MTIWTLIKCLILAGSLAATAVISYRSWGLPTEKDPASVRDFSAQNERDVRGGGPHYGK